MSKHEHTWIDVTMLGDTHQQLYCAQCGQTGERRFPDVNISTPADEARHVEVILRNDGTGRVVELPHPMRLREMPRTIKAGKQP